MREFSGYLSYGDEGVVGVVHDVGVPYRTFRRGKINAYVNGVAKTPRKCKNSTFQKKHLFLLSLILRGLMKYPASVRCWRWC